MMKKADITSAMDEVERCRQVRRALERTHGSFAGLCRWLKRLQRRKGASSAKAFGRKPSGRH
jgi:hypothetical protein